MKIILTEDEYEELKNAKEILSAQQQVYRINQNAAETWVEENGCASSKGAVL